MNKKERSQKEATWLLKEKYHGKKTDAYHKDLELLKKGAPLDYIIGFTPFLNCHIDLSLKPLIPRTETEFWVEQAIAEIPHDTSINILDLFSGSGCIGIALLKHLPHATVDFGEYEEKLLSQISKNIEKNNLEKNRAHIFQTNCFDSVPERKYAYIFANPPYIPNSHIDSTQPSVAQYEPHRALFAEKQGMFFIEKIILEAKNFLKDGGKLYIEFDSFQKELIESFVSPQEYSLSFQKDQFKRWRVAILEKRAPLTH